ncbi:amino acid adenylation domain protein (plasmid) [Leptolyngbya boryana NIES-2135]|jgi:amino acid adenylation domain-containing protein|uniref:Amino acid adenylation domain protein n=1 Tax=Leptolyngbya boryana NIES-2135 TaxID=1973484 RepID=A0A1Z4JSQ4_LEPBY|nr:MULTISPECIES: non-ribosomal peptide synthetase [Leptolyngbya]BAY59710.1 amino acid adenylation domain protein [Leptolyngbya boryana NIES-2135]MBD2370876.1 non-ribosomal peptide synthetase [Leptolyngbya sp. FACHB-161]MBD2377278.1 non-ribosomal peptide synthetase [Leptolyngbya sp. FACHB-238]MBD2401740.1 non-ribosomal peptide synthetase [Leptolyngbya sp. FACHB-239]MBD2408207.1 non-ribosomal peptide synthetase [Leptolyngbya sp. FACHB-402]
MSDLSQRLAALSPEKRALLLQRLHQTSQHPTPTQIQRQARSTNTFPLSFAQQRLWFLNQLEPGNAFYNMPAAILLKGHLNIAALEHSLDALIQRHEALRTNFTTVAGDPVQVIATARSHNLSIVDLHHCSEPEQTQRVQQLAQAEAQLPFDLGNDSLLRVCLLQLSETQHVLLFTLHHIIADAWSLGVLIQEFAQAYSAFSTGESLSLPELPIQYADFAVWQRQWLQGDVLETQLHYWQQQLQHAPPLLELPTDRPRPPVQTFRGAYQSLILPNALMEELKAFSRREDTTLFMTMLAAFKTLLYRYTGQTDLLVGSPIANRNRLEVENIIGVFINTLVLRTDVSGNPTFRELLAQVRKTTLDAYAHQDLPFERLVETLHLERNLSYNPVFQVMFQLQNAPMADLELPGLTLSNLETAGETTQFDLSLNMAETEAGLQALIEYSTDLFDDETIARMLGHFQTLLEGIVAHENDRLSNLPLLTKAEQHQFQEWNQTQVEFAQVPIHQLFEAQVKRTPDAIAAVFEQEHLTYQALNDRANQLASHLQTLGVRPNGLVGICVDRSLEMLVGILAILKAGGAYLPIDPAYPQDRIAFMLEDADVEILLTQSHLSPPLTQSNPKVLYLDSDWTTLSPGSPLPCSPDHLAYVIYTSGSTGKPKGVQIEHHSLSNFIQSLQQHLNLTSQDFFFSVTTITFDIAALELFLPLTVGARVVIASRAVACDGVRLSEALVQSGTTIMQATPATWRLLLASGWQGNAQLKVLCGGEALQADLASQLRSKCAALWNLYGPTETTIWSTIHAVESDNEPVPIGCPIANTEIYVLDRDRQLVPVGVTGELYIGGAGLARGYLNRPELTADRFLQLELPEQQQTRLYRTGDLARYRSDGTIECLGRIDHQVKVRGFRIELGEIESVLCQHPTVQQAAVTVRETEFGDQRIIAYVVPVSASHSEWRSFLNTKLPDYMVPAAFVRLEALPLTPNGKVDRKALPAPSEIPSELDPTLEAAQTPVEEMLASLWSQILGAEIGIHDDFFAFGGHSLLATQLMSRVRDVFNVELPLRVLFETPTIARLAPQIEKAMKTRQQLAIPPLQPVDRTQALPLSFAQQRLWFLSQLAPDSALYNFSAHVRLAGTLNISALEQSVNEVVRRHEALRTAFAVVEGQPIQIIAPTLTLPVPVVDLRSLSPAEQQTAVQHLVDEEDRKPFDLTCCPLLRVTVLRLNATEHVLLLTMHHIISDGWSMGVLLRELMALYEAFCTGQPSPLPALPIQYADFAVWQRQWLQGDVLDQQLHYWKQQLLGGNLPPLKLPTKPSQPKSQNYQGKSHTSELSVDLSRQLQSLSRQENVTLFMTLLAALQTLLHRYTHQDDIVVGTDIANRTHSETESLIGFFVNLLVLRSDMRGNPSFRELLQQVREVTLNAYAHQDLPFDKLVEELQPERNLHQTPLFQVLFVLQNTPVPTIELTDLTLHPLDTQENDLSKFDLALFVTETEPAIQIAWKFNVDRFDPDTIAQMANHFTALLASIVAAPEARLSTLSLQTAAEPKPLHQPRDRKNMSFSKFKSIQPKAISVPETGLVTTSYLQPGEPLPLVVQPNLEDIDLIGWAKNNRGLLETELLKHGAILFRGFNAASVPEFERFAQTICPALFGEYGDLPREEVSQNVYTSTPYPADKAILFHNESSHLHCYPMKIWFFCVQPAQSGGETPIVDCRKVYQLLDPKLQEHFAQKQLMYVRNYTDGLDVSWSRFFHTTDRSVVESYCHNHGIEFEWKANNGLRTREIRPAVATHPKTGETVFFNQIQLHHLSCLDLSVQESLLSLFGEENLPRQVYYGDGTPIEDSVVEEVCEAYRQATVQFPWQKGDILMLDNMLSAHGRNPYGGARKIVVAMGELVSPAETARLEAGNAVAR